MALAGCSAITTRDEKGNSPFSNRVDPNGTLPVLPRTFDNIAFVRLLAGGLEDKCNGSNGTRVYPDNNELDFQCAIDKFYERTATQNDGGQRLERNRIQERILAVSEERCNAYKKYLRYDQGSSNFWLGSTATLSGALGAISPGVGAARAFSAAAGVLTGINAEYNQAFYGNLFYNVIAKGIDERRREAYREIQTYGQSKALADYPVEAAIKDAIVYDGMCSAVSAMEFAEKSIQLVNDPGVNSLNRILVKVNQARDIIDKKSIALSPQQSSDGKLSSTSEDLRFGTLLASHDRGDPQHFIWNRSQHAQKKVADLASVTSEIQRTLDSKSKDKYDSYVKAIGEQFNATFSVALAAYQTNLQVCVSELPNRVKELEEARAALTKALSDKDDNAINQAKHQISQAQSGIDGKLESADFITRHLDDLIDGFIKQSVDDIQKGKSVGVYDISQHGSFDSAVCGKLNPTGAK